jgi:hypothetical protein
MSTLDVVAGVGVIDDGSPSFDAEHVVYTMAPVVLNDDDEDRVRQSLTATMNRTRPLHWEGEGRMVKQRFVDELCRLPITAHVCATIVRRNQQQQARAMLLREHLLARAGEAGAGQLLIEQRSKRENDRDRRDVRDWFRSSPHRFDGISHVAKS